MKIKKENVFNYQKFEKMLIQEDKFISDIFDLSAFPVNFEDRYSDSENEENENDKSNHITGKPFLIDKKKRAQTFEELHSKLNELKGKKMMNYKQKLLKKGLKNRIAKKTKKEERLMQKKLIKTEKMSATSSLTQDLDVPKVQKQKPIFNSKGNMVFSKFDFSEIGTKKKPPKVEKDSKKLLVKLEENKKKIKELEEAGEKTVAEEIKEKQSWKSALAKASGEKVKDDPELLKKTIKKEKEKKKQSSKKWESRAEAVQKSLQERQEKRKENLLKRKKDKKVNKLKKASKKGRIIPGF